MLGEVMRTPRIPPRRLLCIDDDARLRTTLTYRLRYAGHTVEEAEDGATGLAILKATPVDLVLTDLDMPGLSGWDVARAAKAVRPHVPVVLVTGRADSLSADQAELGLVNAILGKPCPFAEIQAVIGRLTGDAGPAPLTPCDVAA